MFASAAVFVSFRSRCFLVVSSPGPQPKDCESPLTAFSRTYPLRGGGDASNLGQVIHLGLDHHIWLHHI
eukprot:1704692-Heterocapsa_arctica.AAC.1